MTDIYLTYRMLSRRKARFTSCPLNLLHLKIAGRSGGLNLAKQIMGHTLCTDSTKFQQRFEYSIFSMSVTRPKPFLPRVCYLFPFAISYVLHHDMTDIYQTYRTLGHRRARFTPRPLNLPHLNVAGEFDEPSL